VNKKSNLIQPPLSEIVANELKRRIWEGEIEFGDRLMEPNLSADLGVSRSSLREALQLLEHEGLVVSAPRRGTFVNKFEKKDLKEIYEARLFIEVYAFEKAVQNIKEEDIKELEAKVQQMKESIQGNKWDEILNLDLEFHAYVVNLCNNATMIKFYNLILVQIRTFLSRLSRHYSNLESLYQEHKEMLEAIKTRDEKVVKEKVVEHIQDAGMRLFGEK
jgi:DNA-binding GntR family transcriptional regulator